MTRKEFNAKYDAHVRRGFLTNLAVLGATFLTIIPAGLFSDYIHKRYGIGWTDDAVSIFMLVMLIGAAIGVVLLDSRQIRRFGLACPTCGRRLTDRYGRAKVLLTGNCPKCGNKVFDEELASKAIMPFGLNREEFQAKFEAFNRQDNRQAIKLLVMSFGAVMASVPVAKYFQRMVDRGGLDWVTLTEWKWFGGVMLGALTLLTIGIFVFAMRGTSKVRHLPCPGCGRSLVGVGKTAIKSGICIYCGARLFEVSSSKN